ncbi:MAG: hypothetical protein ACQEV7_07770 [Bacillota bacterium]
MTLESRLLSKFKNVPNVALEDAVAWLAEAAFQYGYESPDLVPAKESALLLLLAQAEGARNIAMSVAHYFKYQDAEESVDKTMLAEQYRKLANDLRAEYKRNKAELSGSAFRAMRRIDRP